MKDKNTIGDKLLESVKDEVANNVVQHRFSHYRFELELDHNDNVEIFKNSVENLHID